MQAFLNHGSDRYMVIYSWNKNILICLNINCQSLAYINCIITVTSYTELLYASTCDTAQHCVKLYSDVHCPDYITLNGTATNYSPCMFMLVIKWIKDFLFVDANLRPKYEFVLNYFYLYCFLFTLIITTTDSEVIFQVRGGGWFGRQDYICFFLDSSGLRPTVEPSVFVGDKCSWL